VVSALHPMIGLAKKRRIASSSSSELTSARASGVVPSKTNAPVSKLEHVYHAGDRTEAAHDENYRQHQAQNEDGELDIGFHCASA
jgi:hypothetical protein